MARKKRPGATKSGEGSADTAKGTPEASAGGGSESAPSDSGAAVESGVDLEAQAREIAELKARLKQAQAEASGVSEDIDDEYDEYDDYDDYDDDDADDLVDDDGVLRAYKVGEQIEAKWQGGKFYFDGVISAVNSDGTFNITYDDGDKEQNVAEHFIKARGAPSPDPPGSQVAELFKLGCGCLGLIWLCGFMLSLFSE